MKINDVIFCDDIRQEVSNKVTLVGVYNDKIMILPQGNLVQWPVALKLAIYVRATREASDPRLKKFSFELYDAEEKLFEVNGEFVASLDQERPMVLLLSGVIGFKRPGPLKGIVAFESEDGKRIEVDSKLNVTIDVLAQQPFILPQ